MAAKKRPALTGPPRGRLCDLAVGDANQERFQRNGLNPGEAYVGLWRICHDYLEMMHACRKKLAGKALSSGASNQAADRGLRHSLLL